MPFDLCRHRHPHPGPSRGLGTAIFAGLLALGCGGTGAAGPVSQAAGAPAASPRSVEDILRASNLPEPLPTPLPGDPLGVTIHRLENGLTVYISTDRQRPKIAAWIVVRAGGRHDPADSTGLAHYLEHMLFKGTSKIGALDAEAERPHLEKIEAHYAALFTEKDEAKRQRLLAAIDAETLAAAPTIAAEEVYRLYAGLGAADLNAVTTHDHTHHYVVGLPSNRLEHWARIDSERLTNPSFRMFFTELEAVYEEFNKRNDDAERRTVEETLAALFPAHPYSRLVIGTHEHLKNPAFHNMVAFHKRWYVPNNTAIVLAGDVDAATALPIIRAHFGKWQPRPLPAPPLGEVRPLTARTPIEVLAKGEELVSLSWQTTPQWHADHPALQVMNLLMSTESSGLLQRELRSPQKLKDASSRLTPFKEAGLWRLIGTPHPGQSLDEVEARLLEAVVSLKEGRFRREDLAAAVLSIEIEHKENLESNGGRAETITSTFVTGEPWNRAARRLERLRAVTKADVVRVARQYLGPAFVALRRKNGAPPLAKIPKPKMTPLSYPAGRKSAFALSVEAMPVKPLEPEWTREGRHFQRGRLPAGTLLTALNQRNDLFSLTYMFDRGLRQEPLLCHALPLLHRTSSAAGLKERFRALGVTVETSCKVDESALTISGLDDKLEEALALVESWFRDARFTEDDISKEFELALTHRRNILADGHRMNSLLMSHAVLGPSSVYRRAPSNEQLKRADGARIRAILTSFLDHKHETHYFGPRSAQAIAPVIALGNAHRPLAPRPPMRLQRMAKDTLHLLDWKQAQAQVHLSFPTVAMNRKGRALARLLSEYLDGSTSGLVRYEIRERRALAYVAGGELRWGRRRGDEGQLLAHLAAQPDKTPEAITRLLQVLRDMPVDGGRLAEAKRALEERWRATRPDPRSVTEQAAEWDKLGERRDINQQLRADVAALSLREVEAYLRRVTKGPVAITVTGDKQRMGLSSLKGFTIVEPAVEAMHSWGPFPPTAPAVAQQ